MARSFTGGVTLNGEWPILALLGLPGVGKNEIECILERCCGTASVTISEDIIIPRFVPWYRRLHNQALAEIEPELHEQLLCESTFPNPPQSAEDLVTAGRVLSEAEKSRRYQNKSRYRADLDYFQFTLLRIHPYAFIAPALKLLKDRMQAKNAPFGVLIGGRTATDFQRLFQQSQSGEYITPLWLTANDETVVRERMGEEGYAKRIRQGSLEDKLLNELYPYYSKLSGWLEFDNSFRTVKELETAVETSGLLQTIEQSFRSYSLPVLV